jgi:tetratricopeptide (TPR) repeat protein
MDLKEFGKNRIFIIALVVVVVAGYMYMRSEEGRLNEKLDERKPQIITQEFVRRTRAEATLEEKEQAAGLLRDANEYVKNRQYREAKSAYYRAVALYPTGETYFFYGKFLTGMGDYTWVLDVFDLAESLGYDKAEVFVEKAKARALLKQPEESVALLQEAALLGFRDFDRIEKDKAFDSVRNSIVTRKQYRELINTYSQR